MAERLTIDRLGARGDGVVQTRAGPVYVPFSLPGETIVAEVENGRGRLVEIETPSPRRRAPVSPYFTRCGGCVAQHMDDRLYREWKASIVTTALARGGISTKVNPLVDAHGEGRRRVILHARAIDGAIEIGFMAARSHDLVPIAECPILAPSLARAPVVARTLARALEGRAKPLDIQLTSTSAGLDVDIRGHGKPERREHEALVALAHRLDLARLSMHGDVVVERRPPALHMGLSLVVPPPGGFLQATARGEEELARLVIAAARDCRRVVDLFCGCGPLTLRLAEFASVKAVDADGDATASLDRAARHTRGLKPVTAVVRDLDRRPLLPFELEDYDAVVLDPPRAGADNQARQIAASSTRLAVSVSCDAGTFVRDARILIDGGFSLREVTPVDQFRYAAHVELVGVFERASRHRGRAWTT